MCEVTFIDCKNTKTRKCVKAKDMNKNDNKWERERERERERWTWIPRRDTHEQKCQQWKGKIERDKQEYQKV